MSFPSSCDTAFPPHSYSDPKEIKKFDAMQSEWWREGGSFAALHAMNPARLDFIRKRLSSHYQGQLPENRPYQNLHMLDVGCGGGILSAPLARLGANVTGIDLSQNAIHAAQDYAAKSDLDIDFRCIDIKELIAQDQQFDVVFALELLEHLQDVPQFLTQLARCVKPGGMVFVSTLNRTVKSFLGAIVGAEYILRWTPPKTHQWQRFLRPGEVALMLQNARFQLDEVSGLVYRPRLLRRRVDSHHIGSWQCQRDKTAINYIMSAVKS